MKIAQGRFQLRALVLAEFNPPVHVRCAPCHNEMSRRQFEDGGNFLQILKAAANILVSNKQSQTVDKEWSSSSWFGRGVNSSS
jgi:hypothetical protein